MVVETALYMVLSSSYPLYGCDLSAWKQNLCTYIINTIYMCMHGVHINNMYVHVHVYIGTRVGRLYVGMLPTHPLTFNKRNGSELLNARVISLLRPIIWPTRVSKHDKTLKVGKIDRYSHVREIAKTPISSSFSLNDLAQSWYKYLRTLILYQTVLIPVRSAFCHQNLCSTFPGQVQLRYSSTSM